METQALMNMRISGMFLLALLSAMQLQAAELATGLVSLPGSTVKVEGTSNLHGPRVDIGRGSGRIKI